MKSLKEKEGRSHPSGKKKKSAEKAKMEKEIRSTSKKKKNKKKKFKIDPTTDPRHQRCAEKLFRTLNQVMLKNMMITLYKGPMKFNNDYYAEDEQEEMFSQSKERSQERFQGGGSAAQSEERGHRIRERSEDNQLSEFVPISRGQSAEKKGGKDLTTPEKNGISNSKRPVNSSAKKEITELIEK